MSDIEERRENLLRKSRFIDGEEFSDDEIKELLTIGARLGKIDRLSLIVAESRLNKGISLAPSPGSSRDIEADVLTCYNDPDVRAEMLTKRESEVSGVNKDRST